MGVYRRLQANGYWEYQGQTLDTGIPVYQYQAGINMPLFTGGRVHAEIQRANLEVERVKQQREDLRNEIALEVKTALAQLESARHQVDVANLGVQLAQQEVSNRATALPPASPITSKSCKRKTRWRGPTTIRSKPFSNTTSPAQIWPTRKATWNRCMQSELTLWALKFWNRRAQ